MFISLVLLIQPDNPVFGLKKLSSSNNVKINLINLAENKLIVNSVDVLETGMYLKIPQNNTTEEFQIIEIQNNQVVLANFDSTRYNLLQHMPDNEFVNSLKTIMARYFTIENKLYLDKIQFVGKPKWNPSEKDGNSQFIQIPCKRKTLSLLKTVL